MILALDTTREFGSIALASGDTVIGETLLHAPDGFGQILFEHIQRLLDRNGIGLPQIDLFAAASGPGSFTGVRVGLACIKGLAEAMGKPAAAVSNLAALAEFGRTERRATIIDARRGEVYAALYNACGDTIIPECVMRFQDFLTQLPPGQIEFLSTDFAPFRASMPADAIIGEVPREQAAAIARIAARKQGQDPAALDANYIRRSEAEMLWRAP